MRTDSQQTRFEELLESHQKILFKVAHIYCRNAEDRQDLVQEISLQLWRAFPAYDERRRFSTWMYRIALNVAISFARKTGHREQHSVPLNAVEVERMVIVSPEPDARINLLQTVLDQLDALNRALLLLYLEEHSYAEIADILGISETNVATRISRLKQRIRKNAPETTSHA
jgi:RNA polymerase sigma-70 factor (ECF subfamily)